MNKEDIQLRIKMLDEIEQNVSKVNMIYDPLGLEGKVIEFTKTVNIDEQNYSAIKTKDGSFFCVSFSKCGDSFTFDSIPEFDLWEIAIEEVDFGYNNIANHVFELYHDLGFYGKEDYEFLCENFNLIRTEVGINLKRERLEFEIQECSMREDFEKAEELKKQLDEL